MADNGPQPYDRKQLETARSTVRTIDPAAVLDGVYEFFPVEAEPLAFLLAPYVVCPEEAPIEPGLRGVIKRWKRAARLWQSGRRTADSRARSRVSCNSGHGAR